MAIKCPSKQCVACVRLYYRPYPGQIKRVNPERILNDVQAGVPGLITIATNMAGRGTDIILGGNPKGLAQLALENTILPTMVPGETF